MRKRLPKLLAGLAVAMGVAAILAGASVFVDAWQASRAWAGSGEARRANVPTEAPIWLDAPGVGSTGSAQKDLTPDPDVPLAGAGGQAAADAGVTNRTPTADIHVGARSVAPSPPTSSNAPITSTSPDSAAAPPEPELVPPATIALAADVELAEVDFRFLDPPEPGAHARLAVTLVNSASVPTGALSLGVPTSWLQSFEVFGAVPGVLDDWTTGEGERRFVFNGLAPGDRQTVELHVLATAEEVEAPEVRLLLGDEVEIGRSRPRTVAPRPRPGPARAVAIPKLSVRASVVPVPWEPPPYVVGQVQGTADLSLGNTVLIGHLAGPWGDVFARLDRLRPGDEVVATSRGLEYRFIVSEIAVQPYDDVLPTLPTTTPRLTLMTCTGQWSISRQDYSHRLWVVAEPPELAEQTIRANAERAAEAAREAEAAAAARATHEAEVAETPSIPETAQDEATVPEVVGAVTPASAPVSADAVPSTTPAAAVPAEVPPHPVVVPVAAEGPTAVAAMAPEQAAGGAIVEGEALTPGISIDAPMDMAAVSRRFTARGRRTAAAGPILPLWLVVRAEVAGSRWYVLDRPLAPDANGAWQASVELGGPPGIRHEIRVGTVDAAGDAVLRRHAAERSGQSLDELPPGFKTGAYVLVEHR